MACGQRTHTASIRSTVFLWFQRNRMHFIFQTLIPRHKMDALWNFLPWWEGQAFSSSFIWTGRRICIQWISSIQGMMADPGTKRKTPLRLHTSGLEQSNDVHFAGLKRSQPQGNLAANWGIAHQPALQGNQHGPSHGDQGQIAFFLLSRA